MEYQTRKPPHEFTVEELDRELIARGARVPENKRLKFGDTAGTPERDGIMKDVKQLYDAAKSWPLNEALRDLDTEDLVRVLMKKSGALDGGARGIWFSDTRMDYYEIPDEHVRKNAECVAAVCLEDSLNVTKRASTLKVKSYQKAFHLCDSEPFTHQPVLAGSMCTGFLVEPDVIATAAHFAKDENVTDLRFVFGYRMEESYTAVKRVDNIYKGVKMIGRAYQAEGLGADWALVKLDRIVEGRGPVTLSKREIVRHQSIYVLGHPCGLPLKYAPGGGVCSIDDAYFSSRMDIFGGNSGSPAFDSSTHEVIGMVVRGDYKNFRWAGIGYISVIYTNADYHSEGSHCTKVSEFIDFIKQTEEGS